MRRRPCSIEVIRALWAHHVPQHHLALCGAATFRTAKGSAPAAYRKSAVVEVAWALIPVAIVVGAAAPAVRTLAHQSELTTNSALAKSPERASSDAQAAPQ
jgi:heme/copper-type cytochrome/quinol oxidase subunit 2